MQRLSDERWFGIWALDADASGSETDDSPSPRSAVYTILPSGDAVWFFRRWRDTDRAPLAMGFKGVLGQPVPVPTDDGGVELLTHMEEGALVTEVRREGRTLQRVERRLLGPRADALGSGPRADALEVREIDLESGEVHALRYRRAQAKQVLVYRRDLKMRKGKIAAQCAHASMAVFFRRDEGEIDRLSIGLDGPMAAWAKGRFGKVVLSVEDEAALVRIHELAANQGLPTALITDAGKTEFHGVPTRTTVAVGPAADVEIDAITGPEGEVPTKLA